MLTLARLELNRPTEKSMREFEQRLNALPRVAQCLNVADEIDYVVMIRSRDVAHYQEFARQEFAAAPGIRFYSSEIVLAVSKWTNEVPVEEG